MALVDDLVSYWNMDVAGATEVDQHGSNNLTKSGTITSVTGKIGNAHYHTGANSSRYGVTMAASTDLTFHNYDFSVSLWLQRQSWDSAKWIIIGGRWHQYVTERRTWNLFANAAGGDAGQLIFMTEDENGTQHSGKVDSGHKILDGDWHHIVITFNATTKQKIIYVDNSEGYNGTASHSVDLRNDISSEFYVGYKGQSLNHDEYMDEMAVWKRVLTPAEVEQLWNNGDGIDYNTIAGDQFIEGEAHITLRAGG